MFKSENSSQPLSKKFNKNKDQFFLHNGFNTLSTIFSELSLNIVVLLLAQIDSKRDSKAFQYTFKISELEGYFNMKRIRKEHLLASQKELLENEVTLKYAKDLFISCRLLSSFKIEKQKVTLQLSEDISPFMLKLRYNFFRASAADFYRLKNVNAKRLYLLIKQYENNKITRVYPIQELKNILTFKTNYDRDRDVKKAIQQLLNTITEQTNIQVSMNEFKDGRTIDRLSFTIEKDLKHELPEVEYCDGLDIFFRDGNGRQNTKVQKKYQTKSEKANSPENNPFFMFNSKEDIPSLSQLSKMLKEKEQNS